MIVEGHPEHVGVDREGLGLLRCDLLSRWRGNRCRGRYFRRLNRLLRSCGLDRLNLVLRALVQKLSCEKNQSHERERQQQSLLDCEFFLRWAIRPWLTCVLVCHVWRLTNWV